MSECDLIKPLLALRPEDWSVTEGAQVEAHLARCEACTTLRAEYLEQDRLIRALPALRLTVAQRNEVWARVTGPEREARGIIFMGLNVVSALSTVFSLVVLTVNLLLASPTSTVGPRLPAMTAPAPTPRAAPEIAPGSGTVLPEDKRLEPTPVPAPQPEKAYRSPRVGENAWDSAVYDMMTSDMKELG